jgi:hypothetical protein
MSSPDDTIEFIAFHKPALLDGEYRVSVKQQVQIDSKDYGWGNDQWSNAPSSELRISVAGPRFSLDPDIIQSQFPPPKSIGEYYNVLPHIIFNRSTLPWERTIGTKSDLADPKSWMALLLFDSKADEGITVTNLTVKDLLDTYSHPDGKPEFVKILPRTAQGDLNPGEMRLEVGQHPQDRLTVIDVPKQLLAQILPSADDLALLSHVRSGQDSSNINKSAEYPVIFCNRLPAPGTGSTQPVGTQSTVHLVSLEARQSLLDALQKGPVDNDPVRFVSLASWSFSTSQESKTFSTWVKAAWSYDTSPAEGDTQASHPSTSMTHTLRMPDSDNTDANRFLRQGYAPIRHQTRQGNHLVSWYRSPLLPGRSPAADLTLPVTASDQLVRYFSDVGMFDATYAAAWELGRMLTLRSKKVSVSLFNWKRAQAQQVHQAKRARRHLPFARNYSVAPDFPKLVSDWFDDLRALIHVPFHYLVPREEMLPPNSLRFFHIDLAWLKCLLDGAFSIGRVSSADMDRDRSAHNTGLFHLAPAYSGFLLRSPVVAGWPHLGVEAYTETISVDEIPQSVDPAKRMRFDRLGLDMLLCIFEGDINTVEIHEHPDVIHFGVDVDGDPSVIANYQKRFRDKTTGEPGKPTPLAEFWKSKDKRTLKISELAQKANAQNSAEFGVTMIEAAEKVRFTAVHGAVQQFRDGPEAGIKLLPCT